MATLVARDTSGDLATKAGEVELTALRTRTAKVWQVGATTRRVAVNVGPIHYPDDPWEPSSWEEIDLTLAAGRGCDLAVTRNGWQFAHWHTRPNVSKAGTPSMVSRFTRGGHWMSFAPLGLYWENAAGEREEVGKLDPAAKCEVDDEAHTLTYRDAFGAGLHWRVHLTPERLYPAVVIEKELPAPSLKADGLRLVKAVAITWDGAVSIDGVTASAPSELATDAAEFGAAAAKSETTAAVSASVAKATKGGGTATRQPWWWQPPRAWDSADEPREVPVKWEIVQAGTAWAMHVSVAVEDLGHLVYPLYLDTAISEHQVAASTSDGYARSNASVRDVTATNLFFGKSGTSPYPTYGLVARFANVAIPVGAKITSASLSLRANTASLGTPSLVTGSVRGIAEDNCAAFNATDRNAYDVTPTTGAASWVPSAWVDGTWYTSPDLAVPVQEVISRPGWQSGNALGLAVLGAASANGNYVASRSYDAAGNVSGPKFNATYELVPVAAFSGTPLSGAAPLTVQFTDASTNTPTSWDWDYGDGTAHGTTQNPSHQYAAPGTYTVTLTATNAAGSDAEAKVGYVTVSEPPATGWRGSGWW